jgi:hypothetical protein
MDASPHSGRHYDATNGAKSAATPGFFRNYLSTIAAIDGAFR